MSLLFFFAFLKLNFEMKFFILSHNTVIMSGMSLSLKHDRNWGQSGNLENIVELC